MLKDLPEEKIAEFDQKYGSDWEGIEGASTWLAFRKPTEPEHSRMLDKLATGTTPRKVQRELAMACVIYPDQAGLAEAIDLEPALLMADITPILNRLAGEEKERRRLKPQAPRGS